jgi:hypothetical protein
MTRFTEAYGFRRRTLIDRDGNKIGKIDDVYEHRQGDQAVWALVNSGLLGTRKTCVPLGEAQPDGGDIRVPLDKEQVKRAPNVDPDRELSEREERRLFEHYGMTYATDGGASGLTTDHVTTSSDGNARR